MPDAPKTYIVNDQPTDESIINQNSEASRLRSSGYLLLYC